MALHKQLTKGRKNSLTIAARVNMTCRSEGTPPVDPCMYILRFAHKFELGDKTHDVAMTALRLIEFGETPSSSLTLDEFMSFDLEEEHDPPSFKARCETERQRSSSTNKEVNDQFQQIQQKIEEELDKRRSKAIKKRSSRINEDIAPVNPGPHLECPASPNIRDIDRRLMPPPSTGDENQGQIIIQQHLQLASPVPDLTETPDENDDGELDLDGIDDDDIDAYLMTREEALKIKETWEKINADYIQQQKIKQEQLEKERLEGKPEKKKKQAKPKPTFQAKSADEAIKIMLMERKMSNKINYDVLKTLSGVDGAEGLLSGNEEASTASTEPVTVIESGPVVPPSRKRNLTESETEDKPAVTSTSKLYPNPVLLILTIAQDMKRFESEW
ncbi:unnamed protein product [Orchesella dallaii]|uniref:Brf1 TBP-binding domain-containing protein n=1 Tax=Orchesella dallaii TaxID=48710 RepID=A0ABP1Q897_9HEXA